MRLTVPVSSNALKVVSLKGLPVNELILSILMSFNSSLLAQPKQNVSVVQRDNKTLSQSKYTVCDESLKQDSHRSASQYYHVQRVQPSACLGLGQVNQKKTISQKELKNMNATKPSKQTKEDSRPTSAQGAMNVLGLPLKLCCSDPLTGYERDGFCHTGAHDRGKHTVCAIMTDDFLNFTKNRGNDLSTPYPQYNFPGLKAGDRWCLCALRWAEAEKAGHAPLVDLEATHQKTLDYVSLKTLSNYSIKD